MKVLLILLFLDIGSVSTELKEFETYGDCTTVGVAVQNAVHSMTPNIRVEYKCVHLPLMAPILERHRESGKE